MKRKAFPPLLFRWLGRDKSFPLAGLPPGGGRVHRETLVGSFLHSATAPGARAAVRQDAAAMGFGRSGSEPLPFLPTTYMEQEESYPFA
jgi:hypothetical protein